MKNLSRILIVCLGVIPAFSAGGAPVATTAGSNLTAYNPSMTNNNQWATMTNGRYDTNTSAKVDFGNCNAVVLRCAQPKCGNGGCTDYTIAGQIVEGCVKSNSKCKQYGDDLVNFMTAQLVSSSNAKLNQQQVQLEQARIQAEAQASAAAAASNAQSEQISQMQNQMYQMQQQMAQQQAESAQQLQEALAQQAAQSAAALEDMKSAATAAAQQTEAGITSYQQEAINRGISEDVLARQQITGQIMTEIENAEISLKAVKTVMENSFNYAGCDARGNNCTGPKRVKKWRELATDFIDPYDNTIDKIYDALVIAQTVGVDLSQIYMMLNDSCNSWGQYLCPAGTVVYPDDDNSGGVPQVCRGQEDLSCYTKCDLQATVRSTGKVGLESNINFDAQRIKCKKDCNEKSNKTCQKCRLLKVLTDGEDVYEGWVNAEETSKDQRTVVACASGALNSSALFARRTKNKNGAGLVDIDKLDTWLHQTEPTVKTTPEDALPYCYNVDQEGILKSSISSRSVPAKGKKFCVGDVGKKEVNNTSLNPDDDCPFIAGAYAVCDTHLFNEGKDSIPTDTETLQKIKETTAMKVTVISQQMYKQYEYLNATLRRLKTQLEKAVLTSNLEAAGAKSDGSSSGGLAGGRGDSDKTIYLAGANNCLNFMDFDSAYNCLQTNVSLIINNANGSNYKNACLQLQTTYQAAKTILNKNSGITNCEGITAGNSKSCSAKNKDDVVTCAQAINYEVMGEKRTQSQKNNRMSGKLD